MRTPAFPVSPFENNDSPNLTIVHPLKLHTEPSILWPPPEPITYGEALSPLQLNATASVPGTLQYTPALGYVLPAGTHSLWVTFTPAASNGTAPVQSFVPITVARATPVLSWLTPDEISYGTALDDAQLNATASVQGTFDYSPRPGEILPPGSHSLSVIFTPVDRANYIATQTAVTLIIKERPNVDWPNPDSIVHGTQLSADQLCATTATRGTFEYKPSMGALLGAGEHRLSVMFTPEDNASYSTFRSSVPLTVHKAVPIINWPTPEPIYSSETLSSVQLNAISSVPGSLVYIPVAGQKLPPGVHTLSATFTPDDDWNYTEAHTAVLLTVAEKLPVDISWSPPSVLSYGEPLSGLQLNATASVPGNFAYTPAEGNVLPPGRYVLSAVFHPHDAEKYTTTRAVVALDVEDSQSASADEAMLRETRIYRGAVYEKGADHQWHLRQK
jgi:hypothetical protein